MSLSFFLHFLALWNQGSCWHLHRSCSTGLHPLHSAMIFPDFFLWHSLSSASSPLLPWDDSDTERFLTLWVVSWLGSSCVSPISSVRYVWDVPMPHWLFAWCIFSPRLFLQTLLYVHLASAFPPTSVRCTILLILRGLFLVVGFRSTCSSISPPFREDLGVLFILFCRS